MNMAKTNNSIYNVKLVTEVKRYPCLYNSNLPEYTKRDVTDLAWVNVAKSLKDKGILIFIL